MKYLLILTSLLMVGCNPLQLEEKDAQNPDNNVKYQNINDNIDLK